MNFDPRTLAREAAEEEEANENMRMSLLYAKTCAMLQQCYFETESYEFVTAFQRVWDKGVKLVSSVEFYMMISAANERHEKEVQQSQP